jgi:rare lipoprotein A
MKFSRIALGVAFAFAVSAHGLAFAQGAASAPAAAPAPVMAPAPAAAPAAAAPMAAGGADVSEGKIAHYGRKFAGRRTASGERFNPAALTLAHNSLPFGTKVRITNLANKRSVVARVNDRGPSTPGRIADLSTAAARRIGMLRAGIVEAKLEVVSMPTAKAVRAKKA